MAATYFTEDHEWVRVEDGIATVGITDHAQDQLGDLVFVQLPDVGQILVEGRCRCRGGIGQGSFGCLCAAGRRSD